MFMHAGAAGNPGARPLLLGTVLMLLFLTISTDWSPHRHGQQIRAAGRAESLSRNASRRNSSRTARQGVHEKIIYELSVGNERLERENAALRQHVLDVWRASRAAGLDLNATSFLPIPGLEDILGGGASPSSATAAAGAEGTKKGEALDAAGAGDSGS